VTWGHYVRVMVYTGGNCNWGIMSGGIRTGGIIPGALCTVTLNTTAPCHATKTF